MVETALPKTSEVKAREDALASLVGQFGRWQLLVFASVSLVKLSSGWVQMAILFLTPSVVFWCEDFGPNSTKVAENSTCYSECLRYGYDTSPFDSTIVSEWGLVCERGWLASFTQTMLQLGVLVGSSLFGFLSDRYGRKITFLIATTSVIILGMGVPFSPSYAVFTTLRFFLGVAAAGTMVVSFVIVMETVGTDYREILGCLFQIPFIIGHMTVPLFAYYFRSWHEYTLALAIPPLIYLGYFFTLNESPRWLVSVGRVEEATRIVTKAAERNGLPTAKIAETLTQMSADIGRGEQRATCLALLSPALRTKTVVCCALWLVSGITFFGFNQYISQTSPDPFVSVAAAGAIQVPSILATIWLIRHLGRKLTTATFSVLGGVCAVVMAFTSSYAASLALGTLGVSCASIVATSLYVFTSEMFPTVIRNMGMGASSTFMRVGSMIAPFVSNLSLTVPWLPTVIFGAPPIAAGLMCFLLPETKGTTLPDSMEDIKNAS